MFHAGANCAGYLFIVTGTVKVRQFAENGREIVLYRIGGGETCILTATCMLGDNPYQAEGIAEEDTHIVALPKPACRALLAESEGFRKFLFSTFAHRLADIMLLFEEVFARRTDCRLPHLLVQRAHNGDLAVTHQELAAELGTAREVVSRQLKEFERRRWVRLERAHVTLLDRGALTDLAASL